MRRRDFIVLLGSVATLWPIATRALQSSQKRRLGILEPFGEGDTTPRKWVAAFVQELRKLGWTPGDNIQIEYRWPSADVASINSAAAELVELRSDVILAGGPLPVAALQRVTSSIPIVFEGIADPVGSGIVASLARPGGNTTGFAIGEFAVSGKILEFLKRIAPHIRHVGVMYNPVQVPQVGRLATIEALAPSLDVQITAYSASSADQITPIVEGFGSNADGGMIILPSPITIANLDLIVALMARRQLPAAYEYADFVRGGGLLSYGSDPPEQYRQGASYVDRILKGAKPADLPVQQPTKFTLAINMKTAKALSLTVPPGLLAGANEVIE
jgi:putative tryptophan/tyrosine transport system substrate-binding protein